MELITFMMCSCDSVTIFSMKNFWGLAFQILYLASKGAQMPISLCRLVWPNAEQFSGKLNLEIRPHVLTGEVLMVSWEVAQMDFVEECGCAVFVLLVERWCQIWDANVLSAWRCVLHTTTTVVVVVQAHFQQLRYIFFPFTHNYSCSTWILTSKIVPLIILVQMCGVETKLYGF